MNVPAITPSICYRDPVAATAWLCEAFGFTIAVQIESPDGDPAKSHHEIALGPVRIAVSGLWAQWTRNPAADGTVTGWLSVELPADLGAAGLDAHCERARKAGAYIEAEPADEFFGARRYRAVDPAGHHWSFQVTLRDVSRAEAEAHLGIPVAKWE